MTSKSCEASLCDEWRLFVLVLYRENKSPDDLVGINRKRCLEWKYKSWIIDRWASLHSKSHSISDCLSRNAHGYLRYLLFSLCIAWSHLWYIFHPFAVDVCLRLYIYIGHLFLTHRRRRISLTSLMKMKSHAADAFRFLSISSVLQSKESTQLWSIKELIERPDYDAESSTSFLDGFSLHTKRKYFGWVFEWQRFVWVQTPVVGEKARPR